MSSEPFDRVVLGPHALSVHVVEHLSKKKRVGESDFVQNTICLRNDQSASNLRSTLMHEVVHHIAVLHGLRLHDGWSEDLEEAVCIAFEGPMLELFTRPENAPLREWLQGH